MLERVPKALLFGTYLGGSGGGETLETHHLALNPLTGDLYVGATSGSIDDPTTPGAYQRTPGGGIDMVVTRFSATGQLLASTYVGGDRVDFGQGIALGSNGNVYISGFTSSTGGFLPTLGPLGADDALGIVLLPDLSDLVAAERVGGRYERSRTRRGRRP